MTPLNFSVSSSSAASIFYFHGDNMFLAVSILRVVLLLPLSASVLRLAFLRWRPSRSLQSATHSDVLTYNLAAIELLWVLSFTFLLCGTYLGVYALSIMGTWTIIALVGEILSNTLSCLDWYLAVLHPVAYMRLRSARGALIRSAVVCALWLVCLGYLGFSYAAMLSNISPQSQIAAMLSLLSISITVVLFCSFSVVCALTDARPGAGGGDNRKRGLGQSKRRAFVTVVAIMAVQALWFAALLMLQVLYGLQALDPGHAHILASSMGFLNLPSSLVMPVLFLHKAGQLSCRCIQSQ